MIKVVKNFEAPISSRAFFNEAKEALTALFKNNSTAVTYTTILQPENNTQEADGTIITAPYYGVLQIGDKRCIVNTKPDLQALTRVCIDLLNDTLKCLSPWLSTSITYSNTISVVKPKSVQGYPYMKVKYIFAIRKSARNLSAAIVQSLAGNKVKHVSIDSAEDAFEQVSDNSDDSAENTDFFG